ncbi:ABC transporter substrate-binding protein [Xanthomonas sp. 60]
MRSTAISLAAAIALAISGGAAARTANDGKAQTLAVDATLVGEITSGSGINYNDGSRHQIYDLTLKSGQLVELSLSGALDGTLTVVRDGMVVATSGRSEDSNASLAFRADTAGSYRVAVNGSSGSAYGPFRLQAREVQPYDGAPLRGAGSISDLYAGGTQTYTLQVAQPGMYRIDLTSSAFDTVLTLNGNGVNEEDDDGGSGTNARMGVMLQPGTYTLGVKGINDTDSGQFRLTTTAVELAANAIVTDGATVQPGTTAPVLLNRGSGERRLALVMARAGRVRIEALSDQVDTFLQLDGRNVELRDDDGGNGTNARIETQLAAGRYTLVVSSLEEREAIVDLRISEAE